MLVSLFIKEINDFSVLFCQLKVHASKKRKKLTKGWTSYFLPPFFYFLICFQVWLRSGQGKVSLSGFALFFFHMVLKSVSPQIHIDSSALFCKLKISHSFDADRNAVLCSPPHSWKHSPGRPAFPFFYSFEHIFQILEKRLEKSIKSMNGFPSKTRAFKGETERDTGGWGWCFGSSQWKLLEWNNEKQKNHER